MSTPGDSEESALTRAGRAILAASMVDAPPGDTALDWRALNASAHVATLEGQLLGIAYTQEAGYGEGDDWVLVLEFWWMPAEAPDREAVLFGVAEGTDWWETRWDRAHHGVENLLAYAVG